MSILLSLSFSQSYWFGQLYQSRQTFACRVPLMSKLGVNSIPKVVSCSQIAALGTCANHHSSKCDSSLLLQVISPFPFLSLLGLSNSKVSNSTCLLGAPKYIAIDMLVLEIHINMTGKLNTWSPPYSRSHEPSLWVGAGHCVCPLTYPFEDILINILCLTLLHN